MKKALGFFLLSFSFNLAIADNPNHVYVSFFYDLKSIGKHLTDAECQKYYSIPLRYTIENDKPNYLPHPFLNIKNYQRMTTFKFTDKSYLYSGIRYFTYPNHPTDILKEHISFNYSPNQQMVEGSFYVEDYCQGHFVGVDEYKHRR